RWKSADTPVSWSFFPLPQSPAIPSPVIPDAYGRRLGFSVIRFARNNEWTHRTTFLLLALIASIERPTEARHGDRHRHQHQCNECNRIVLQIGRSGALQHDGADDADVMGQRQALAEIL